jgi:hypothetical protein
MIDGMKEARNKVEVEAKKTIATYETIKDKEIELQKLEDKITQIIYEAINQDTGKAKFTNETQRGIAIRDVQLNDPIYQGVYIELRKLRKELEESKLAYDLAKKDFTIAKLETMLQLNSKEKSDE